MATRLLILGADGHARAIADVAAECGWTAYASLSPGVILCGAVTVESGAFLGAGAPVLPGLTVGKNVRVPAGAVVPGNIQPGGRTAR